MRITGGMMRPPPKFRGPDRAASHANTGAMTPRSGAATPGRTGSSQDRENRRVRGWQTSLCSDVKVCFPSKLPTKDVIAQRKVPRNVSRDPSLSEEESVGTPRRSRKARDDAVSKTGLAKPNDEDLSEAV